MSDWTNYLLDSFELEEDLGKLSADIEEPPARITRRVVNRYFTDNLYPFRERLSPREYFREKHGLQIELVKLQNWIKERGERIVIIFEGRDAAGKGSTIKRFMEHLNPRVARVVALEKPSATEQGQWYFQRYVDHLPTWGEIVFFDRSWYNRAGVERVMGFCSETEYQEFVRQAPVFEQMLVRSGIRIIKFYLSISRDEQAHRFRERETNPLKRWKLSPVDREAQTRWDAYTQAKQDTFELTDTDEAPWVIIKGEDKLRARLAAMRYVLTQFEYADKDAAVAVQPHPLLCARVAQLDGFSDD